MLALESTRLHVGLWAVHLAEVKSVLSFSVGDTAASTGEDNVHTTHWPRVWAMGQEMSAHSFTYCLPKV